MLYGRKVRIAYVEIGRMKMRKVYQADRNHPQSEFDAVLIDAEGWSMCGIYSKIRQGNHNLTTPGGELYCTGLAMNFFRHITAPNRVTIVTDCKDLHVLWMS